MPKPNRGRRKPTSKEPKKDRMLFDYGTKYPAQCWLEFTAAIREESNPQNLHLFIEDCMNLCELALDQLKDIPHPEVDSKRAYQRFV